MFERGVRALVIESLAQNHNNLKAKCEKIVQREFDLLMDQLGGLDPQEEAESLRTGKYRSGCTFEIGAQIE